MNQTRYSLHVQEWDNCLRCPLGETALNTVLARGSVPAEIVFVGEAPGESENVCGIPFIGKAGKLLDHIIEESSIKQTYAIINLVGCIPRDTDGDKTGQPDYEHIMTCSPRVIEFIDICKPRLIVCVGKLSEEYFDLQWMGRIKIPDNITRVAITHPAAILRGNPAQKPLMIRKQILTIQNAIHKIFGAS